MELLLCKKKIEFLKFFPDENPDILLLNEIKLEEKLANEI